MLNVRWERPLRRSREDVWNCLFDAEAAKTWLGVDAYIMPEKVDAPFCWFFDTGSLKPTAYVGRLLEVQRPARIDMLWELSSCQADTRLIWELSEGAHENETLLVLRHENFPEEGLGPFEYDGFNHHWDHILDGLEAYLDGAPRDTLHRHGAMLGIIPMGAAPEQGLLIQSVIRNTPAERAGLLPGDFITQANEIVINRFDDWDEWIDHREPGEEVTLRLSDRELTVTLGKWQR